MPHGKQSPFTVSKQAVIDERRRHVASMRLRGMTQREIEENLPRLKIINAETGKPYSLGTINSDLQAIRQQWRDSATQDMAEHVARIIAELTEIKRAAWAEKSYGDILRAIEKECKILGIDSPDKQIVIEGDLEILLSRLPEEYQNAVRSLILTDFVGGGPTRA